METNNKTYYFNVAEGVRPADHEIIYSFGDLVTGDEGSYLRDSARLEVSNPKAFTDYLEDATGHYVEHATSWESARDYLIDLSQAMLLELAGKASGIEASKEISAYIEEEYADGVIIVYGCDFDRETGEINLYIDATTPLSAGKEFKKMVNSHIPSIQELNQMVNISEEELNA